MSEEVLDRLKKISDEIVVLRSYMGEHPANELLIALLEAERAAILKEFIKIV